jgi:hypothetical protein
MLAKIAIRYHCFKIYGIVFQNAYQVFISLSVVQAKVNGCSLAKVLISNELKSSVSFSPIISNVISKVLPSLSLNCFLSQ